MLERAPLPGLEVQTTMSPTGRVDDSYDADPDHARRSAVLILLYGGRAQSICFPAIIRATDGSPHSGQIGLPGGAVEDGEAFPVETALREAAEEVGLERGAVTVLGTLTPLYIPVSNYSVTPVVAASRDGRRPALIRDAGEVEEIIDLSAESLQQNRSEDLFETPLGRIAAPCYRPADTGGIRRCVWGATAMMLAEFLACHDVAVSGT